MADTKLKTKTLLDLMGNPRELLLPLDADKDTRHRMNHFFRWLQATKHSWLDPDLAAHRDYLLDEIGLSPVSVTAHLATIRSRYRSLMRDPSMRKSLYVLTPDNASPADRKALVDEVFERLRNRLDPESASVPVPIDQDHPDSHQLRLTPDQAKRLMQQPGMDSLRGIRDTAVLALFLCTGIREAELCGIDVEDLRHTLSGELALYIRAGKGRKRRLIPYGELDWVLVYVDRWLENAGIESGAVFRGFYKGNKTLRKTRISKRAVSYLVTAYPITIGGETQVVQPHDLRRTYAHRLYEAGVDINRIRQNLGHTNLQTTLGYIGELDAHQRRPPAIFDPPHSLRQLS
ncbi:MAG: tyrosine-type recombinase/integrase [Anaerolineae bacterium]|nr:tyrosine-type recombinase/integrase [Anaerolineae bacterium]